MALSNEDIQFRERIAEFIGTITTRVKQVKDDVDKIEAKEDTCQKELHSRINKVKDDSDKKINKVKDDGDNKIKEVEKAVVKINTTVEVTRAQIAAYGAIGGIAVSAIIWLLKLVTVHYMK